MTTKTKKTYKTTEIQDRLAARLAATEWYTGRTFAGEWWGRGDVAERFYFGDSATIKDIKGKPTKTKVWLQFDDPATLDGVSLRVEAKKTWHRNILSELHAEATCIAVELVDPEEAAKFRAEIAAAKAADEPVGDMVRGEEED